MSELDTLIALLSRVFFAVACGSIVGFERERRRAPAGFKTQILICVGSAVMASISGLITGGFNPDPETRVIAQIITGVGFLGAGAIIHNPANHVLGLTTAAWIWFISGMGILCGLDHGLVAIGLTLILAVVVFFAGLIENIYIHPAHPSTDSSPASQKTAD
jgi:putative Mg2+ transporter-C (MgtC) family protein